MELEQLLAPGVAAALGGLIGWSLRSGRRTLEYRVLEELYTRKCNLAQDDRDEALESLSKKDVELRTVHGCTLCVLTRGETASLRILFDKVLPDWAPLFEGGWIANTANEYFTCDASGALSEQMPGLTTGGASKENMLEQLFPFDSHTVMLVDDSISRGSRLASSTAPGELGGVSGCAR